MDTYHTNNGLIDVIIDCNKIYNILQTSDPRKAHGHEDISIRKLNLCISSIVKSVSLVFQNWIDSGSFPDDRKKCNIVPVHKENCGKLVDGYRPVSLLPICSQIFEELILDSIFLFLK